MPDLKRCARLISAAALALAPSLALAQIAKPPAPQERPAALRTLPVNQMPRLDTDVIREVGRDIAAFRKRQEAERAEANAEIADLTKRAIEAAAAVQRQESAVMLAEDNLDILAEREKVILTRFKTERSKLTDMLAALQRLERQQPPALAVEPDDATDAVRSSILLAELVPRLRQKAEALARELDDLRLVRQRITEESKALEASAEELKGEQARLETLVRERGQRAVMSGSVTLADQEAAASIAARAENLTALVEELGQENAALGPNMGQEGEGVTGATGGENRQAGLWTAPGARIGRFSDAIGRLKMPAVGKVVEKFGVPNDGGGSTKGIKIGVRPGAQVIMPFDGRVKYAGPLKIYGQVLIVETADDYLIILAGLSRVDAAAGQWLLAGEPVGRMANRGDEGPSELYVEFRKGREPVDPLPWLEAVTKEG